MKFISWNVNGLRACLGKGFMDYFTAEDADFFCLQETKMQPGQAEIPGILQKRRAIPAQQSLPNASRFPLPTALAVNCTTMKAA